MIQNRCPVCGTSGKPWNKRSAKDPEVFLCPHCFSLFSEFGMVLESQKEIPDTWS